MDISSLLAIDAPILQAPMAGAQSTEMAVAVSRAGGLGAIPAAMLSCMALDDALSSFRALTNRPCNVNFFCHQMPVADARREQLWRDRLKPYYDEYSINPATIPQAPLRQPFSHDMAEVLEQHRPAVVSFHFGLPERALLNRVKATGAMILSSATTVEEACWLEQQGADAIILQGLEAGGHRGHFLRADLQGQLNTAALLAAVRGRVSVPLIAAGGISDISTMRALLDDGISAVQLGTLYLCCDESTISDLHRTALMAASAPATALTNLFSGRPARGIMNRLMKEQGPISDIAPAFPTATTALAPLRAAAEKAGKGDFSPLWSGTNTGGCRAVSAYDLTRQLAQALVD